MVLATLGQGSGQCSAVPRGARGQWHWPGDLVCVEKASALTATADMKLASTMGVDLASPQAWMWHLP